MASSDSCWHKHVSVFPARTRSSKDAPVADRQALTKPFRLSWTTPDDKLAEQTFLGFGRLSMLFECLKHARMTPGRPLDLPMLKETSGRLESIPQAYRSICALLVMIGARTALADSEPDKLKRVLLPLESRVMSMWEIWRMGPVGSRLAVSANILVMQNLIWSCGANASIATAAGLPSTDATALRTGFARAHKSLLDLAVGRNPNVPISEIIDRVYPATVVFRNTLHAAEWQSDPLMTDPAELEKVFGTIIARDLITGRPSASSRVDALTRADLDAFEAWLASKPPAAEFWATSRVFLMKARHFAAQHLFSRKARSMPFNAEIFDAVASLARYFLDFYLSEGQALVKAGLIMLTGSAHDSPDPEARHKIDLNAHKNSFFTSLAFSVLTHREVTERIGRATDPDEVEALRSRYPASEGHMTLSCRVLIEQLAELQRSGQRVSHSRASSQVQALWHPLVHHISTVPASREFDEDARLETMLWLRSAQREHVKAWPRAINTITQVDEIIGSLRGRVDSRSTSESLSVATSPDSSSNWISPAS